MMTQRHSFLHDESNNKKKDEEEFLCRRRTEGRTRAKKVVFSTETKTPTRFERTWEEDPDDGSLFFRDGAAFFFVLRSKERRCSGKERERGSRRKRANSPNKHISRYSLISERRIAGRTVYTEEDERRGRRTQKRRRSAAPRGGSESAKRIHDHENQRKLDGRGTPTVRRGHRAVRRPRGFGFFFLFFFFRRLNQSSLFFVPAAPLLTKERDVFCLNRTMRRARANVDRLYRYFFSLTLCLTLIYSSSFRDETDTSETGSKLKNT